MATNLVQVLGNLGLSGGLIFQEDNASFPENPSVGTMILKGSNLYAYVQVGDFTTWYPFNSKTRSYIHTQGQARLTWTINHGLGTENVWYQAYNSAGAPIFASRTIVDSNTFTLELTEAITGTVVVVAPDTVDVPTIKAQSVTVAAGTANVTVIDNSGIKVNSSYVASQGYVDSAINGLATVASSGSYADLTNKPTLFSGAYSALTGKPSLATVATSGAYADLSGKPSLATVATSGSYNDLTDKPAGLSFSGAYADLTGKPTLFSGSYTDLTNKPSLFSGSYADLSGKPSLATVATSGAYADLTGKPSLFSGDYNDLTNKPSSFSASFADLSNLPTTLSGYGITDAVTTSALGVSVATLDGSGKVPSAQLPSYVDDVLEYDSLSDFPVSGETGKIYVTKDTNLTYRWSGTTYIEINSSVGSSDQALKLTNSRSISATGDASWTVSFDGSANATAALTLANSGVTSGTYGSATKVASVTVDAKGRVTGVTETTVTPAFSSVTGKPTTLSGYGITDGMATSTSLSNIAGLSGTSGLLKKTGASTWSLDTASYLTGNETITFSGDVSGSGTTSVSLTLANSGVTSGTYGSATKVASVTVDAKGRVTGASEVSITPAFSSVTGKPTTLSGYGITDAISTSGGTVTGNLTVTGDTTIQGTTTFVDTVIDSLHITSPVIDMGGTPVSGDVKDRGVTFEYYDTVSSSVKTAYLGRKDSSGRLTYIPDATNTSGVYSGTAGTIQANIVGSVTGNADTSSTLQTTRTISATGDATWSVSFNGGGNATAGLTLANSGVSAGTYGSATKVSSVTVDAKGRVTSASEVSITPAFSAISGLPTTLTGYGITDAQSLNAKLTSISALSSASTGLIKLTNGTASLDTSTYLTGNQTITVSGDASGSGSTSISLTLANSGVSAGTYKSVTVDVKGRVTAGTNPTTLSGYGITDAAPAASPTFTGTTTVSGSVKSAINALGSSTVDCSAGNYFTITTSGNTTFTFSNAPASSAYSFTLKVVNTTGTLTFPAAVIWTGGNAPAPSTGKTHLFMFMTDDGGTTWRGAALVNYAS